MPKERNAGSKAPQEDPEYLARRAKNNEAIKKSREKARAKAAETKQRVDELKTDNKQLEDKISALDQEMKFLKDVFIAHGPRGGEASSSTATSGSGAVTPASVEAAARAAAPTPQVAAQVPKTEQQPEDSLDDLLSLLDRTPS